ncbi:MAG TPA: flagellar protein FlaG [Symbiobacteriaceae bacterium]|nr:flagellar protein FlaG [Symbiobacteriaceae bacterium]
MRIRASVTPTPIVSMTVAQNPGAESQAPVPAPVMPAPPKVETGPLTVDLGDKVIELQPGELAKVVDKVNQTAQVFNQSLRFQMGQGNQIVIRVIDMNSGQVVREIPPEKFLDAYQRMEDALGLLIDLKF